MLNSDAQEENNYLSAGGAEIALRSENLLHHTKVWCRAG